MPPQGDSNSKTRIEESVPAAQTNKASQSNLIGATLGGRYVIERERGRGGMGAVYLARDKPELHSRPVVVKVLLEDALKHDWEGGKR